MRASVARAVFSRLLCSPVSDLRQTRLLPPNLQNIDERGVAGLEVDEDRVKSQSECEPWHGQC